MKMRLSSQVFTWKKTSDRESLKSLPSLSAHKVECLEGLLNLPFLETVPKYMILKPTKNRRKPTEN